MKALPDTTIPLIWEPFRKNKPTLMSMAASPELPAPKEEARFPVIVRPQRKTEDRYGISPTMNHVRLSLTYSALTTLIRVHRIRKRARLARSSMRQPPTFR